jgi:hypothetical protein
MYEYILYYICICDVGREAEEKSFILSLQPIGHHHHGGGSEDEK